MAQGNVAVTPFSAPRHGGHVMYTQLRDSIGGVLAAAGSFSASFLASFLASFFPSVLALC